MSRSGLLAGIALVAACATATQQISADRLSAVPESDRELAESLFDADQVVAGRLVQIAEAQEYERPGQLVFGAAGTKATAALAYTGDIRVDSTLLGRADRMLRITFFAPRGAAIPRQDTTAIWILHRRVLWRLKECAERQSVTSTACPSDNGLALDSNADIRPLADWPRLRSLIGTLGLDAGRR
ncbi:MAG TPA: hypothetical protein VJJ54_03730 [Gemmatimonadales bacterium]|nr:hypothetical protein [Gemmatimonadales bacterium]